MSSIQMEASAFNCAHLLLDLIRRLFSLLFDIHERQVRVYLSLVDALLQLVAGLGACRPDA